MKHERLKHGAVIGRSRSLGTRIHFIVPGSLTSYCSVPIVWALGEQHLQNQVCRNCIREMAKISNRMKETM